MLLVGTRKKPRVPQQRLGQQKHIMETEKYLRSQLRDCFKVIDTCLACFYANERHMYKPLAGQLRILLCDSNRRKDNSLLPRIYPALKISGLAPINWSTHRAGPIAMRQPDNGTARIAMMPFEIIRYRNGLVVANLLCNKNNLLDVSTWMDQDVTIHPTPLTAREIVRHIADKGGGSHIDKDSSPQLRYMSQLTPAGQPFGELFVLALGRLCQAIGEQIFDYKGPKVPPELQNDVQEKFKLTMAAHVEYAEVLTGRSTRRAERAANSIRK